MKFFFGSVITLVILFLLIIAYLLFPTPLIEDINKPFTHVTGGIWETRAQGQGCQTNPDKYWCKVSCQDETTYTYYLCKFYGDRYRVGNTDKKVLCPKDPGQFFEFGCGTVALN